MTLPDVLQRLTACLPADPANDGPIGVEAGDLRALLEANHFPQRYIVGSGTEQVLATFVSPLPAPAPDTEGAAP